METFGEKLKQCIEEKGYSIRQFALECDFDRPWLTNIINNKKNMPASRFEKIIDTGIFDAEQINKLRYIYYSKDYSEAEFERIKFIINHFGKTKKRDDCIKPINFEKGKSTYFGSINVQSVLYYILEQEEKLYYIYTNVPASSDKIIDIIYHFIKDNKVKDYKHIMFTDNGVTTNNLNTYFTVCDFAEIGYDISLLNSININQLEQYNFFPYYFIVNNKILLFDSEFNNVNISVDMQKIAIYQQKFIDLYNKATKVTYKFNDAIDFMKLIDVTQNNNLHMSIADALCVTPALDYDILKANANPMLPNKEPFIKAVLNHYNQDYSNFTQFITTSGIIDFAKNGIIHEIPEDYLLPVDIKSRIQLLKQIINKIKNEEFYKIFLLNPTKIKYNFCDIQLNSDGLITICGYKSNCKSSKSSFCGEWSCLINNKNIYNDFLNTKDFLINNQYIYNSDYAVSFIGKIISELEAYSK